MAPTSVFWQVGSLYCLGTALLSLTSLPYTERMFGKSSILSSPEPFPGRIEGCDDSDNESRQTRTLRYALHYISDYSGCSYQGYLPISIEQMSGVG